MRVTIISGDFTGQAAEFIGAFDAHSASLLIDGVPAILPAHWLEFPKTCNTYSSKTKPMRLPAHLEPQIRAIAKILEGHFESSVTLPQNNADALAVLDSPPRSQPSDVQPRKTARKSRNTKRDRKPKPQAS